MGLNTPHPQGLTRPWVNPRDLASRRFGVRGDPRTARENAQIGLKRVSDKTQNGLVC